jgi:hypothetical protein
MNWLGFQMPAGVNGCFGGHALDAKRLDWFKMEWLPP